MTVFKNIIVFLSLFILLSQICFSCKESETRQQEQEKDVEQTEIVEEQLEEPAEKREIVRREVTGETLFIKYYAYALFDEKDIGKDFKDIPEENRTLLDPGTAIFTREELDIQSGLPYSSEKLWYKADLSDDRELFLPDTVVTKKMFLVQDNQTITVYKKSKDSYKELSTLKPGTLCYLLEETAEDSWIKIQIMRVSDIEEDSVKPGRSTFGIFVNEELTEAGDLFSQAYYLNLARNKHSEDKAIEYYKKAIETGTSESNFLSNLAGFELTALEKGSSGTTFENNLYNNPGTNMGEIRNIFHNNLYSFAKSLSESAGYSTLHTFSKDGDNRFTLEGYTTINPGDNVEDVPFSFTIDGDGNIAEPNSAPMKPQKNQGFSLKKTDNGTISLFDRDGQIVWTKNIPVLSENHLVSAIFDDNGTILALAKESYYGSGENPIYVILDSDGEIKKEGTLESITSPFFAFPSEDNKTMTIASTGKNKERGDDDIHFTRIDSSGNILSDQYTGSSYNDLLYSIDAVDSSGFLAAASIGEDTIKNTKVLLLLKTDIKGTAEWSNVYVSKEFYYSKLFLKYVKNKGFLLATGATYLFILDEEARILDKSN